MLDVLIRGAEVVDGTGAARVRVDVGIRNGRIVTDASGESARRTIDADALVLSPGFVDVHTHYDAQIIWDGSASPSLIHGTTSIIGGNCGFTIAPLRRDTADYLMRMLAVVEGMPLESLQAGPAWDWDSFGDYLGRLEGTLAINAGFLVGHSALRLAVMGLDAVGKKATSGQIAQMAQLLDVCLKSGGLGFSTTQKSAHVDANGVPVPSVYADGDEVVTLSGVLSRHPGTSLEFAAERLGNRKDAEDDIDLMTEMSRRAGRPINWNTIRVMLRDPQFIDLQLQAHDFSQAHGGRIVALTKCRPNRFRAGLNSMVASPGSLNLLPGWAPTFTLDLERRKRALADPEVRRQLRACEKGELTNSQQRFVRWEGYDIAECFAPELRKFEGRRIGDLAREQGREPFDVLVDLALADDLQTVFITPEQGDSDAAWQQRAKVWLDPRTVVGASDAGAHLDVHCGALYTTTLLETVRTRRPISLEAAVRELTDVPARFYGLKQRGRIAAGWHADLVLFDPNTVSPGRERTRADLPGGGKRLYAEPTGIERIFVNGVEVATAGKLTGDTPGRVLRSGRDSDGVGVSGYGSPANQTAEKQVHA
jgi:N-acyl-D-aspartate/D-glutamate deacylase